MNWLTFAKSVVMDIRAWRRGERRIAPRGVRGRIYERKSEVPKAHLVKQETKFRVVARVIRANGTPDEHFDLSEGGKPISQEEHQKITGSERNG